MVNTESKMELQKEIIRVTSEYLEDDIDFLNPAIRANEISTHGLKVR